MNRHDDPAFDLQTLCNPRYSKGSIEKRHILRVIPSTWMLKTHTNRNRACANFSRCILVSEYPHSVTGRSLKKDPRTPASLPPLSSSRPLTSSCRNPFYTPPCEQGLLALRCIDAGKQGGRGCGFVFAWNRLSNRGAGQIKTVSFELVRRASEAGPRR